MDNVNPATLMGFINDNVKGKVPIGRIDLLKSFSFFEVPEELANKVVSAFRGMFIEDRKLVVQIAQDAEQPQRDKKKFYDKDFENKNKKKKYK